MVRTQGPMMSLAASGTLAKTIVFSNWKGRSYVRERVIPSNPRSGGQVGMRAMFKFLTQDWTNISAANKATWETRADQNSVSEFNAYLSYNQFRWRDFKAPTQHDPEDTADTAPTLGTLAAAAGVRSITVTQPVTAAADGWGIAFFRSTSTGFDSAYDNLVAVKAVDGTNDVIFVDSPLDPGTYYYVVRSITDDGQLSAQSSEVNATVT